jgi:hypothetical protein
MLPSEVIHRATTWDIFIFDAAIGYEAHLNRKNNKNAPPEEAKPVTDERMLKAFEEFKKGKK